MRNVLPVLIEHYICKEESKKGNDKYFFISFTCCTPYQQDQKSLVLFFHRLLYLIYLGVDYKTRNGIIDLIFSHLYEVCSTDHVFLNGVKLKGAGSGEHYSRQ